MEKITRGHVSRIFTAKVSEDDISGLEKLAERVRRNVIDRRLKSLEIMESML